MVIDGVGWVGQSTRQACLSGNRCPTTRNGPICYHIKRTQYLYFHILTDLTESNGYSGAGKPTLLRGARSKSCSQVFPLSLGGVHFKNSKNFVIKKLFIGLESFIRALFDFG